MRSPSKSRKKQFTPHFPQFFFSSFSVDPLPLSLGDRRARRAHRNARHRPPPPYKSEDEYFIDAPDDFFDSVGSLGKDTATRVSTNTKHPALTSSSRQTHPRENLVSPVAEGARPLPRKDKSFYERSLKSSEANSKTHSRISSQFSLDEEIMGSARAAAVH